MVYSGLAEDIIEKGLTLSEVLLANKPSGNSYMDLFADLIRTHGKLTAKQYALMLGADPRKFEGAIRCMSGMSALDWINEYLRLASCDLLGHTKLSFKEIGRLMGLSASSFSQFFRAYQHMEPYRYRSLKQENLNRGYHLP
jgi:AraC-like DNA-binding protein